MSRPLSWTTITKPSDAPGTCGVYQYWDGDKLLYIGKAVNLKVRLASHAQNAKLDPKEAAIVAGDTIRYTETDTEFKALILESELIRRFKPPHNRVWKDDKSYLYIVIDLADSFPRPSFARAHDLPLGKKVRLFGPFPNSRVAEEVLRGIRRLIPFCMAKRVGRRACFYSRLGLCSPCPGAITQPTEKRLYRRQIHQVVRILEGKITPVIKALTAQMQAASRQEDFEMALKLRTKIERFERFIHTHSFTDRHFSYNNSEARLEALQTLLTPHLPLSVPLHRLECYDASNSGTTSVVSLTVMTNGLPDKGEYRRFKLKNPRVRSDFDRLDEVLARRFKHREWPRPDLLVIDGGTPQLRRLQRVFDRLPQPPLYLGLAKHPDRLVIPTVPHFTILRPPSDHPGLQLLQALRDEAHRFANNYRKILQKRRTAI